MTELLQGQRVVLIGTKNEQPDKQVPEIDRFYYVSGDSDVFDLDDQNRVFPRTPQDYGYDPVMESTVSGAADRQEKSTSSTFPRSAVDLDPIVGEDELAPYIHLDGFRVAINRWS